MSFFSNLKAQIGNYFLKRDIKTQQRKREVVNFQSAKNIGLLFDANDPEEYDLVKKYLKYLKDAKKKVKAIGFFNSKHIPQMEYSKLDYDFFTKKELNWWDKPTNVPVKNFVEEEYDILINFSLKESFPLIYITGISKAKFKVGKYTDKNDVYDLMIEQPEGKDFKFFMRQIDHYLGIINATNESSK